MHWRLRRCGCGKTVSPSNWPIALGDVSVEEGVDIILRHRVVVSAGRRFLSKLVMLTCKSGASLSVPNKWSGSSSSAARRASVLCWLRSPTCRNSKICINCLSTPRSSARLLGSIFSFSPSISKALVTVPTASIVFPNELSRSCLKSRMPRSRRGISIFSL